MKIGVLYNLVEKPSGLDMLPDNWSDILKRFKDSYCKYPAGVPHDLYICTSGSKMSDQSKKIFKELNYRSLTYMGKGWDIGAYQHCAKALKEYDFVLFLNSQTFFVVDNWLSYFAQAYHSYGPGIYGASSSFEVAPHIRTSCFASSPKLLRQYPLKVDSRYDACVFEHSPKNFSQWVMSKGFRVRVVMCSGSYPLAESRQGKDIFRRGTQEDLVINDRHTLIYKQASSAERQILEQVADGKIAVNFNYESNLKQFVTTNLFLKYVFKQALKIKNEIKSLF